MNTKTLEQPQVRPYSKQQTKNKMNKDAIVIQQDTAVTLEEGILVRISVKL